EPYVAKRFFEIGNGRGIVSIDENSTQLAKELTRLAQGDWFLNKFYERAEETSTEVSPDFMFARGLLAQEILDEYEPSLASGMTMHKFLKSTSSNPNGAITWLLEPLRAASIERWSGTLEHPTHSDKAGKTIDAFMHFSHTYSQQTFVFADLQRRAPSGKSALILFDVMTHTLSQDSGVGDHGPDGIEVILAGHTCGAMCDGLEMGEENTISESFKKPKKARKGKNWAE
ncbi:kinase-like domain-containing protein, partial [Mycena maculata]